VLSVTSIARVVGTGGLDLHVDTQQSRRRSSLEDALRQAIRSGRLAAGQRIPSSRAMALDLGWARGTVASAYEQLVAEGYLEARTGVGTVVAAIATRAPELDGEPRFGGLSPDLLPGAPEPRGFPVAAWLRAARDALSSADPTAFDYGDPRGHSVLRQSLATYLGRARGGVAEPERVVIGAGAHQVLWMLCRVVAARGGRTIAMEDPCHEPHRAAASDAGLEVLPLPVDELGARVDVLAQLRPSAVFVTPAHQYPLGVTLAPARRQELVAWARTSGALVIEDDYDGELRYDRRPVGSLQGTAPDVVAYVGTASKILGPGVRLGWCVVPDDWVAAVAGVQAVTTFGLDVTAQLTFARFLDGYDYDRLVRARRARYRRRVGELVQTLQETGPFATSGIAAGGHILVSLPDVPGAERALVEAGARRGLALLDLDSQRHGPEPRPPAIVLGYTRSSAVAWPPVLTTFQDLLREVFG
jgi:GntR family transcriptional regulator/MocR family aminotransferase